MPSQIDKREEFKKQQYERVDEIFEDKNLGGACILCYLRVPGGNVIANAHHEILSKGQLPGINNWNDLFDLVNIALACQTHHAQLGHIRLIWMKAMVLLGVANPNQYRQEPYRAYWHDDPYPPVGECLGSHGFGSEYFKDHEFPESLARLFKIADPQFSEIAFCEFCPQANICRALTEGKSIQHFIDDFLENILIIDLRTE